MKTAKREIVSGGPLNDAPDHYMITVSLEGELEREWKFVRKPDGTYWEVAAIDLFPRSGGTLRIDLGNQIIDAKALSLCEQYYSQVREAAAAKLRVLGLRRLVGTNPQAYELRLYDMTEETRGYFQTTRYGTEEEVRAILKVGKLSEGQIEFYFARAS
jgi:hypothetical protein